MKEVHIYTDGACSYNPGPGGWGIVMMYKGAKREFSGFEQNTTNNRMELIAVIEALKRLREPCKVHVYSDSAYVVNAYLQGWVETWNSNNWRTKSKTQVKNPDLWQELDGLVKIHKVIWHKVKGHSDNEWNNRCDKLARDQIDKFLKENGGTL